MDDLANTCVCGHGREYHAYAEPHPCLTREVCNCNRYEQKPAVAPAPVVIPPVTTCREALDRIQQMFKDLERADMLNGYGHAAREGNKLVMVLSALRGPDLDGGIGIPCEGLKACTTAIIRLAALGPMAYKVGKFSLDNVTATEARVEFEKGINALYQSREAVQTRHFYDHVRQAFGALGLEWGKVNVLPSPVVQVDN
jgi:hypothetical protein